MSDNTDKLVELMQKQNETLEKMDWKLWEMMNMIKEYVETQPLQYKIKSTKKD